MHSRVIVYSTIFVFCVIVAVIANVLIYQFVNQSEDIPNPNSQPSSRMKTDFDDVTGSPEFMDKWKTWKALPESRKREWLSEPEFEWMDDYLDLVAVSDAGISTEDFEKWVRQGFDYADKANRVPIPENQLNSLQTDSAMFDCRPYILNDELKSAIQNAPKLLWLRLSQDFEQKDLELLRGLKHLRGLSLKGVKINSADLRWLASLENLKWIELEPGVVESLMLPSLPRLQFLHLAGHGITDQHLPSAGQFPILKNLEVDSSEVTDDGVSQIAENCPGLVSLHLGWCDGITYDSVKSLARLKALRYLYVNHTPLEMQASGFEYQTIPELQIKLPECHIRIGER